MRKISFAGGRSLIALSWLFCLHPAFAAEDESDLQVLTKARLAATAGRPEDARRLATEVIARSPKNVQAYVVRAQIEGNARRHQQSIADYNAALALDGAQAVLYDQRGSERFKAGDFSGSLTDFDKFLELRPDLTPEHWRRGIAYYYAGRFEDGQKQFEGYQRVDHNDVENVTWRFLCMARKDGLEAARKALLPVERDSRVPMMQIYELFAGRATADDVLAAANKAQPDSPQLNMQLFYAYEYLALYSEAAGDRPATLRYLKLAVPHVVNHYMWDVAKVHLDLLEKQDQAAPQEKAAPAEK